MNTKSPNSIVSPWLVMAILALGMMFLIFVVTEYRRNTELIEQNRLLIAESAKERLSSILVSKQQGRNWAGLTGNYRWIQHPPKDYWFNNSEQEFPWSRSNTKEGLKQDVKWADIWSAVDSLSNSELVNEQRLILLKDIDAALANKDKIKIRQTFDAYIEHKNAFILSPFEEIAFSLKLVEIGIQDHWSPELVSAILLTGGTAEAPIFRPVADFLFRHNNLFMDDELKLIVSLIQRHLEVLNLPDLYLYDYLEHALQPKITVNDNSQIVNAATETLIDNRWLLTRLSETLIRVEPVNLALNLQQLEDEFEQLNVLDQGDSLTLNDLSTLHLLSDLVIKVDKQQLSNDRQRQAWYLAIKVSMLTLFLALILLSLRLVEKHQQRKLEYLALKEDFVKLVSHELKTPLAGIRAMGETLRKRVQRGLDVQSYPERIVSEADKLWYMVDNILGFNRVQTDQLRLDKQTVKLSTLSDTVVNDVRTFSNKPYALSNTIGQKTEEEVDAELFSLVLKNIVVNAGLYNINPEVIIELSYNAKERCLYITDNGIGISEQDRVKVFEPFVRLSQTSRQSGTGLGLALCKRIMQLHDGDLTLAESNNNGSVWKISFSKSLI